MTLYALDASFKFTALSSEDPGLDEWLETVSDHLASLGATDVSIVSDGAEAAFTVSLVVESANGEFPAVVKEGMDTLRTAFHACDGGTPDWPTTRDALGGGVRITLVESTQRVLAAV